MENSQSPARVPITAPGTQVSKKEYPNSPPRYRALNCLAGTVAILNRQGYELLERVDGVRTDADLAEDLARSVGGLDVTTVLCDVRHFLGDLERQKLIYFKGNEPAPILETTAVTRPEEVWLNVTNSCNLRCLTCFKDAGRPYTDEMSTEKMLHTINEISDLGVGCIVVSGGEPFRRPDIFEILSHIAALKITTLLITNGTLIDEEAARQLGTIRPKIVQISLDGSCPEVNDRIRGRGSFEKTIKAAKLLIAEGLDVRLYPTVTKLNMHDLINIRKLVGELRPGFNHLAFARFHPTGRGLAHEDELAISDSEFYRFMSESFCKLQLNEAEKAKYEDIERNPHATLTELLPSRIPWGARKINCGLGSGTFSIDADGKVYPCQWLHRPEYLAGDLTSKTLAEIYHRSQVFRSCREIRVDYNIAGCTSCEYRYFCGGACRARALKESGSICGSSPDCSFAFQYFHSGLWAKTFSASDSVAGGAVERDRLAQLESAKK